LPAFGVPIARFFAAPASEVRDAAAEFGAIATARGQ
jgi:hypothetical protein